jgi:hypothetical protein
VRGRFGSNLPDRSTSDWLVYQEFCAPPDLRVLSTRGKERCESGRIGLTANAGRASSQELAVAAVLCERQVRIAMLAPSALSLIAIRSHHFDCAVESALNP